MVGLIWKIKGKNKEKLEKDLKISNFDEKI